MLTAEETAWGVWEWSRVGMGRAGRRVVDQEGGTERKEQKDRVVD
jgi:hypothetical protein